MRQVGEPDELTDLLVRDRETHLYGLADLEEPFWSASRWYRSGKAAVGLVSLPDEDWVTGYAMSRLDPVGTLTLLGRVHEELPPRTWVTGALGLDNVLSAVRPTEPKGTHWRMILDTPDLLESGDGAVELDLGDVGAMTDLHQSDPGQTFWMKGMLASNPFVGVWDDTQLVASAGTHVVSDRYGVAAIGGVITRPSHRGHGLGRVVMSALCRRLCGRVETIGLNVETSNSAAVALYDSLGFRRALRYEETHVL